MNHDVRLLVNGVEHSIRVEPRQTVGQVLREDLKLTGTHLACETGVCGACTVLLDGQLVRSCTVLAVQAQDAVIETVESFGDGPEQQLMADFVAAVEELNGFQCGFCAPGIVNALRYARRSGTPTTADDLLDGHLCRCTGYINLRTALDRVLGSPDGSIQRGEG